MIKVLFVCAGNYCRSPMAAGMMRALVEQAGLRDQFVIESAGTHAEVGLTAHPRTLAILRSRGIEYHDRGRQVERADLDAFDYVLALDRQNLNYLRRAAGAKAEISLLLYYAYERGLVAVTDVPDPYYDDSYERAAELIDIGCRALLEHIRASAGV